MDIRRNGFRLWIDYLPKFWTLGFDVYRTPPMFSMGRGPEYGFYVYFGPFRVHGSYAKPYDWQDLRELGRVVRDN